MPRTQDHTDNAPRSSKRLVGWFRWYLRRYLRKGFHSICLAKDRPLRADADAPLIVYLNHASWWDPLVAIHLSGVATPDRTLYAPFDAEALSRYPIFEELGFFGVDLTSRRGAAQFLRSARAALSQQGGSLWMTPEGRFVDPRESNAEFQPGLAHLAHDLARTGTPSTLAPLAVEYPFWEERLPEALCCWGEPIHPIDHPDLDKAAWNELLTSGLRDTQQQLAQLSLARDPATFDVLLGGKEGVGGLYETVRRLEARLTGREYRAAHGEKLRDETSSTEGLKPLP